MTEDPANGPHAPSEAERAARAEVRKQATGLTHHDTESALEAAEAAAEETSGALENADDATRATVAEWRRITDLLFDHGGPYSPDTDAFVQGQLTAREADADSGRGRRRTQA
ncbi:hypothetical protein [Streptomyces sp. TBY4]|uniref:hypothetical protein n=1 Tax=Streptomyces sp. TBY4 TaxID=2962030 RepID=UPI0020B84E18|nr:hypothetical protein [Streptomyces sp. TBY4]MCP3759279.1 hypothetical protein [Streptomyces sp. TBY4]